MMKIGLSYDLKERVPRTQDSPDDCLEEYDSLETIEAIAEAIEAHCHSSVVRLGGGKDFLTNILQEKVDLVFNIAEGLGNYRGREAQVPSVLEMLNVPYTGSDPLCLALCLDKPLAKSLVTLADIATPGWQVITSMSQLRETDWRSFPIPAFIKPAHEGSSKGVRLTSRAESHQQLLEEAARLLEHYQQPVMVEEFINGDEVTVGLVGNSPPQVVWIMRILPKRKCDPFVYSLEVKRYWESLVDYECPAQLDAGILERITDSSLTAFKVLGCRDLARIDFRVGPNGIPYFLEMNPLPGLNPRSGDLPIMAGKMGWTHETLVSAVLDAAFHRYQKCISR
jgi:D-alanine-D-alanine ligase